VSNAARVLVATALVALLPTDAAAKWTRLRSANFEFIGDAPAGQIRRVAEKLEQFREVMTRALPGATGASPVPTIVVVFATDRSLTPVKPLFRGNATEVGGYFQSGEDLNYIAVNGEFIDIALLTVFHEYAHFLVSNTVGNVPVWLGEGLAEFYDVTQGRDRGKSVIIGGAPRHHVDLLKESTLIPIKELLSITRSAQVYNEGSRRGVFYAQSWALTHYLTLGSKERGSQFRQYLASLRSGMEDERAFIDSFGTDTTALDRELFNYVRQFTFPAVQMQFAEKVTGEADRGTTMDDLDAEIYIADLQARIGRDEEARSRLQAIVGRKPGAARAWSALGLIDFRARRFKEALPQLERAAEQDPRSGFVQTAFGRALIAMLNDQESPQARAVMVQKARTALSRATELDANSADAAGLLGYVELLAGSDMPRAVTMLERASRLAPSREQYRLLLAQALLRQREFARATAYLGPLMASGRSAETRSDARRLLSEMADLRTRAASGTTSQPASNDPLPVLGAATELVLPSTRSTMRLDLRPVKNGELRVLGMFRTIECRPDVVVLHVDADGRLLRIGARQLGDVDFITYRSEPAGSVSCGALPTPVRVLATYRARATPTSSGATDGDVVAIELLPDGYTPPSR
jgi:tetratricopeptide (TPR) repeat protein